MKRINDTTAMKNRIEQFPLGMVFTSSDFADIAPNSHIGVMLSRIEKEGMAKRVLRGVYYKPEYNAFLGEYVAPSPNLVAEALARSYGWTITPCGDTALNVLGLSTQIPAAWSYVSDGMYKEYKYDNTTIKFKHTTNKEVSKLSRKTALVVQALKALGKDAIDETTIDKLKETLSGEEKKVALKEAMNVTSWIYEYIKQICKEGQS